MEPCKEALKKSAEQCTTEAKSRFQIVKLEERIAPFLCPGCNGHRGEHGHCGHNAC